MKRISRIFSCVLVVIESCTNDTMDNNYPVYKGLTFGMGNLMINSIKNFAHNLHPTISDVEIFQRDALSGNSLAFASENFEGMFPLYYRHSKVFNPYGMENYCANVNKSFVYSPLTLINNEDTFLHNLLEFQRNLEEMFPQY